MRRREEGPVLTIGVELHAIAPPEQREQCHVAVDEGNGEVLARAAAAPSDMRPTTVLSIAARTPEGQAPELRGAASAPPSGKHPKCGRRRHPPSAAIATTQ